MSTSEHQLEDKKLIINTRDEYIFWYRLLKEADTLNRPFVIYLTGIYPKDVVTSALNQFSAFQRSLHAPEQILGDYTSYQQEASQWVKRKQLEWRESKYPETGVLKHFHDDYQARGKMLVGAQQAKQLVKNQIKLALQKELTPLLHNHQQIQQFLLSRDRYLDSIALSSVLTTNNQSVGLAYTRAIGIIRKGLHADRGLAFVAQRMAEDQIMESAEELNKKMDQDPNLVVAKNTIYTYKKGNGGEARNNLQDSLDQAPTRSEIEGLTAGLFRRYGVDATTASAQAHQLTNLVEASIVTNPYVLNHPRILGAFLSKAIASGKLSISPQFAGLTGQDGPRGYLTALYDFSLRQAIADLPHTISNSQVDPQLQIDLSQQISGVLVKAGIDAESAALYTSDIMNPIFANTQSATTTFQQHVNSADLGLPEHAIIALKNSNGVNDLLTAIQNAEGPLSQALADLRVHPQETLAQVVQNIILNNNLGENDVAAINLVLKAGQDNTVNALLKATLSNPQSLLKSIKDLAVGKIESPSEIDTLKNTLLSSFSANPSSPLTQAIGINFSNTTAPPSPNVVANTPPRTITPDKLKLLFHNFIASFKFKFSELIINIKYLFRPGIPGQTGSSGAGSQALGKLLNGARHGIGSLLKPLWNGLKNKLGSGALKALLPKLVALLGSVGWPMILSVMGIIALAIILIVVISFLYQSSSLLSPTNLVTEISTPVGSGSGPEMIDVDGDGVPDMISGGIPNVCTSYSANDPACPILKGAGGVPVQCGCVSQGPSGDHGESLDFGLASCQAGRLYAAYSVVNGEIIGKSFNVPDNTARSSCLDYSLSCYGNWVDIKYQFGSCHVIIRYAHLSQRESSRVNLGPVSIGDFVGIIDHTGYSTGPHLHLQVFGPGSGTVAATHPELVNGYCSNIPSVASLAKMSSGCTGLSN